MSKLEIEHYVDEMKEFVERVQEGLPVFVEAIQKVKESFGDAPVDESDQCGLDEVAIMERLEHSLVNRYDIEVTWRKGRGAGRFHAGRIQEIHVRMDDNDSYVEFSDLQILLRTIQHVRIVYSKPSISDERWRVGEYYKTMAIRDSHGNVLFIASQATIAQTKTAAKAPEMRDALEMVRSVIESGDDFIRTQRDQISDALEKAGE